MLFSHSSNRNQEEEDSEKSTRADTEVSTIYGASNGSRDLKFH